MIDFIKFTWSEGGWFERTCLICTVPLMFMLGTVAFAVLNLQAIVIIALILIFAFGMMGFMMLPETLSEWKREQRYREEVKKFADKK